MIVVYRNPQFHLSSGEVDFEIWEFNFRGEVISDACAQTIASWWHSPGSPNSTALSTMGVVTADMELSDFANQYEYTHADNRDRDALDALKKYIQTKQGI